MNEDSTQYFVNLARHLLSMIEDAEDRLVVKRMMQRIDLSEVDTLDLINEKIKQQTRNEGDIIYLESVYRRLKVKKRRELEKVEDDMLLGAINIREGRRLTKNVIEALTRTDEKHIQLRQELDQLEVLHDTLVSMVRFIFAQDRKHEQLSVNYRRELHADERSE